MDVQINCPHCNGLLSLKKEWFGMGMNCPLCQQYFNTEAPEEQPEAPQAAQAVQEEQAPQEQPAQAPHQPATQGGPRKKKMAMSKPGMKKTGIKMKGGKKNFSTSTNKSAKMPRTGNATRTRKAPAQAEAEEEPQISEKTKTTAAVLCFFFGAYGVHRFYTGKVMTGLLMLFTLGCLGIWALIDFIMILTGGFKDSKGLPLK